MQRSKQSDATLPKHHSTLRWLTMSSRFSLVAMNGFM
jgi:hypothetical protein